MESKTSPNAPVKATTRAQYQQASGGAPSLWPCASSHLLLSHAASPKKTPPPSPAITLLDLYEIEWITAQLERLISSSSSSLSGDLRREGREISWRKGLAFGSRFRRRAMSLCGSVREAVVEPTSKSRVKPT